MARRGSCDAQAASHGDTQALGIANSGHGRRHNLAAYHHRDGVHGPGMSCMVQ